MTTPDGFYTTKVLIEVEYSHQFDPVRGMDIITTRLTGPSIPAVKSIKMIKAESNYQLHDKPLASMKPVEFTPYIIDNVCKS